MRKRKYIITYLKCPTCSLVMSVPRTLGRKREKGHIKDLYCVNCKCIQKFKQEEY